MTSALALDAGGTSWDFIWPVGRIPFGSELSPTFTDATTKLNWQMTARRISKSMELDSSEMVQIDLFIRHPSEWKSALGMNMMAPVIDATVNFRISAKGTCCESRADSCFVVVISKPFKFTCCYKNYSTVLQFPTGSTNVKICCRIVEDCIPRNSLTTAWNELLNDDTFSDVTICTSGKSFPAHKNILSVRSPVFKAMFRSELSECRENRVALSAFPEKVVQGFLEFLYTDKTTILPEHASEWLQIADMYQVDGLKFDVEKAIGEKLTIETAVGTFYAAHLYNAQHLKRTASIFVQKNAKAVASMTSTIEEIAKRSPEVTAQLVLAMHSST